MAIEVGGSLCLGNVEQHLVATIVAGRHFSSGPTSSLICLTVDVRSSNLVQHYIQSEVCFHLPWVNASVVEWSHTSH